MWGNSRRERICTVSLGLAVLLALAASGCRDRSAESQLARAGATLEERRTQVALARERLATARMRVREAQRDLRSAEAALLSADERVVRRATDVAVFRAVQSAFFEDERLADELVVALVEDARVTVAGIVSGPGERDRALSIARNAFGVEQVYDWLEVEPLEEERGTGAE